jgi:hypothetical protein
VDIFRAPSPINKATLLKISTMSDEESKLTNIIKNLQYEVVVEKKMFFGNYKPRVLRMYLRGEGYFMSYGYVGSVVPKNEFELQIDDYAIDISETEFEMHNSDMKYTFKVSKSGAKNVTEKINGLIRHHFNL